MYCSNLQGRHNTSKCILPRRCYLRIWLSGVISQRTTKCDAVNCFMHSISEILKLWTTLNAERVSKWQHSVTRGGQPVGISSWHRKCWQLCRGFCQSLQESTSRHIACYLKLFLGHSIWHSLKFVAHHPTYHDANNHTATYPVRKNRTFFPNQYGWLMTCEFTWPWRCLESTL